MTRDMKTIKEKAKEYAKEYADSITPVFVSGTEITFTVDDLNEFAQRDYLAGYSEAMRWRDPKEERPGKALPVIIKYEVSDGHVKYWVEEYSYGRFAYDADDIGAKIIGWRPIE